MSGTSYYPLQRSGSTAPSGAVHHVDTPAKVYAPTFDCCATCVKKFGVASNMINDLIATKTKATFFLTGEWMMKHPDAARRIIANKNFEVGFHGFTHSDFPLSAINPKLLEHEINGTRKVYEALLKNMENKGELSSAAHKQRRNARLFRFPSGNFDKASLAAVSRAGLIPIQWNGTADNALRPNLERGQKLNGSIWLAHANMSASVRRTDSTFPHWRSAMSDKNYQAVTVSELMRMGKVAYTLTPEPLTPHDRTIVARNQSENARHGYGMDTMRRFIASLEPAAARITPRPTHGLRYST